MENTFVFKNKFFLFCKFFEYIIFDELLNILIIGNNNNDNNNKYSNHIMNIVIFFFFLKVL